MKKIIILFTAFLMLISFVPTSQAASSIANQTKGQILLQVESKGEAWYVYPDNLERYYLGRPADAFQIMRELGLGATHAYITSHEIFPYAVSGKILIDVEDHGKAYYIYPNDRKAYYLGRPADAFRIMRELGLGITTQNLNRIEANSKYDNKSASSAWQTYLEYKTAVFANNFDALQEMSYSELNFETDCFEMEQEECKIFYLQLTQNILNAEPIIEESTISIYEDSKQAIIVSKFHTKESTNSVALTQRKIFIVYSSTEDSWKILKLIDKTWSEYFDGRSMETTLADLKDQAIDTDKDGYPDADELNSKYFTSPDIRDSDNDGWWDGVEMQAVKDPTNKYSVVSL